MFQLTKKQENLNFFAYNPLKFTLFTSLNSPLTSSRQQPSHEFKILMSVLQKLLQELYERRQKHSCIKVHCILLKFHTKKICKLLWENIFMHAKIS